MNCVNCGDATDETFTVVLGNGDRIQDVPLCRDCDEVTRTERREDAI